MEFIIVWYPALKFGVSLLLLLTVALLLYTGWLKVAAAVSLISGIFLWLSPVKIDGTESISAHKAEVAQRTTEYSIIESEHEVVTTYKPTFKERMAEEDLRSDMANKRLEDELLTP